MIPVRPVRKPRGFDKKVKVPGNAWLAAHPGAKRPKDYWSPYLPYLEHGFRKLCGYAAMLDPTGGTVDHYLSCKNHPHLAYEWKNYRFASQALNASKKTADATVLDPYEVGAGWFEILLPSLQMQLTAAVPPGWRKVAEYTLKRLKLRDGEKIIRWRSQWYEMYRSGDLTLAGLDEVAPLIAEAVRKQQASAPTPPVKGRTPRKRSRRRP
jgi:hypothetical protein